MDPEEKELNDALDERFNQLPKIVQDAITSADVEKQLRTLADVHKLHLDQWDTLENEVQMTLLGFQEVGDLAKNIESEVKVSPEVAAQLAQDISKVVFEPIRDALDRGLGSPQAKAVEMSGVEQLRDQILKDEGARPGGNLAPQADPVVPPTLAEQIATPEPAAPATPTQPPVVPGTPPAPAPETKATRAPISGSYLAQNSSSDRKSIEGDPYREPIQ